MHITDALRKQVNEGRPLAAEVPAEEGRRAFVVIRPVGGATTLDESLRRAKEEGQLPTAHEFIVRHDEYDEDRLDGSDYDVGHVCHAQARVATVEEAEAVITGWGFDPARLVPYHQTDAP